MSNNNVEWAIWEALLKGSFENDNERDITVDDAISNIADGIINDPAYQANAQVNGVTTPLVITPTTTIKASLLALPETNIHIGDLVSCFDEQWLVVELYYDKVGIIHGILWLCNKVLNFQAFSSTIHQRYCVIDDGTYSKRSSDPDVYVMNNTYKIFISMDNITQLLHVDKRLALDVITSSENTQILEVYKIIGIDRLSRNFGDGSHLMVLTVQRGVYDPDHDDISTLICDVYQGEDEPEPEATKYCRILGRNSLRVGATSRYSVQFINNGETVNASPVWTVTLDTGSQITYGVDDGVLTIQIPLKENEIGNNITITARDENSEYEENTIRVKVIALG